MLIFWPPEPSKIGDSGPGFPVEGWMHGQPARMDRGTFPSGLEGKSGTHSEARRKGSLSGTVMDVGHPDEGEKDHPWKTPCPSSPWVMPFIWVPRSDASCCVPGRNPTTHRRIPSTLLLISLPCLLLPLASTGRTCGEGRTGSRKEWGERAVEPTHLPTHKGRRRGADATLSSETGP